MISVDEALKLILSHSLPEETEAIELSKALGRTLRESVKADRDSPPFDRVTMDGIAIHSSMLGSTSSFPIENIQAAGLPAFKLRDKKNCIEVMTGAILPANTDCVIPYEQINISDGVAFLHSAEHKVLQNIHKKGRDATQGETLLIPGQIITPSMVGVLASVGVSKVQVNRLPKIAICSTGDELVDIDQQPEIHQIRKSNSHMLQAALLQWGISAELYHLQDDQTTMKKEMVQLVENYRILLFSGAVSKGKFDFLPEILQEMGMEKFVHGVAQRPGKPFLFGSFPRTIVFGFPGNPASTLVCFNIYFKPWLHQHLGIPHLNYSAQLQEDVQFNKPLTYHLLVNISQDEGCLMATPLQNSGSGDLIHLGQADAVISLPPEKETFLAGEVYPIFPLKKNLF
jgi:molybdopterin molybdotransferase